jgi:hypothetical protein
LGFQVDIVEDVLEGETRWETPEDAHWKEIFLDSDRCFFPTGLSLIQAYFRILLADVDYVSGNRLGELATEKENIYMDRAVCFISEYLIDSDRLLSDIEKANLFKELENERDVPSSLGFGKFFREGESPSAALWTSALQNAQKRKGPFPISRIYGSEGRSFFTTPKGFIGTGPPYAKKGDVVCFFRGARVPFLLRKKGDCYQLVGEAFVLGLMDGEVEELEEAKNGPEEFVLQ